MIAIVTGATGDIGKEFIRKLYDEVDSIWAVGRSDEKLSGLAELYGDKIIKVKADLSDKEQILSLCRKIESEKPEIKYLVNNAGIARMAPVSEFSLEEISDMLDINDKAATLLCRASLPFMTEGSYILNVASASAFQPNPYIALYSASKAYLLSFTRSLNVENDGITCTAVCPGWVDTKMLPKKNNGKEIKYPGMVNADIVIDAAIKDARKGKDVSVCSFYYRYMRFLSKVMPHRLEMKLWVSGIKEYL
ncbi:MAG: SDR family NAD(P)-dependent oxidoreductase [Clostridiales bacterium]|nr:SDR family NAD(P)-dependent oxidoreductase [Clostridiales bacterium]